jgi:hypothetical protein
MRPACERKIREIGRAARSAAPCASDGHVTGRMPPKKIRYSSARARAGHLGKYTSDCLCFVFVESVSAARSAELAQAGRMRPALAWRRLAAARGCAWPGCRDRRKGRRMPISVSAEIDSADCASGFPGDCAAVRRDHASARKNRPRLLQGGQWSIRDCRAAD